MWHRRLPWAISAIALILVVVQVPKRVTENVSESTRATEWLFALLVVLCALLGAFILSRQGNNMVGWILLTVGTLPSVASLAEVHVHSLDSAPAQPTMGLVFALWVENLSWLALIFPLLHLLLVFPTGRLLSPRWKWVVILECTLIGFIVLSALTTGQLGPIEGDWTIDNPIGLGLDLFALPIVNSLWNLGLATIALAGAASMLLRYRRSDYAQRQQIKLLLFAFLAWALSFALSVSLDQGSEDWPGLIFGAFDRPDSGRHCVRHSSQRALRHQRHHPPDGCLLPPHRCPHPGLSRIDLPNAERLRTPRASVLAGGGVDSARDSFVLTDATTDPANHRSPAFSTPLRRPVGGRKVCRSRAGAERPRPLVS